MFNFLYEFFQKYGVIIVFAFSMFILLSTCGTKGKIHFLNKKVDSLENIIVKNKKRNSRINKKILSSAEYDSLSRKNLRLSIKKILIFEKKIDNGEMKIDWVRDNITDTTILNHGE